MPRRMKSYRHTGLVAAAAFMAATAAASPAISSIKVANNDQQERLFLSWNEAAPVQMDKFPAERQVVLTLQGATLTSPDVRRFVAPTNSAIEKVRINEVTLSNGATAVQMTLTLRPGVDVTPVASANALTVLVNDPNRVTLIDAAAPSSGDGFTLTNADLRELGDTEAPVYPYGSPDAPLTGAGQASGGGAAFFVPPDITAQERADSITGEDQTLFRTNEKFREVIKNLDVKDGELLFVLRGFAKKANMNIIANPAQVKGRITVSLQGVTLGDALEAILKANNLAYKIEPGGIVRIVPRDEVRSTAKETVTQAIPINWVSANDVKSTLTPFLTEEIGQIEVANAANLIIIREVPENMSRLQDMVRSIDAPEKQVKMELRMVDMTEQAIREMGFRTNFISRDSSTFQLPDSDTGGFPIGEDAEFAEFPTSVGGAGVVNNSLTGFNLLHRQSVSFLGNEYDVDMQIRAQEDRNEAVVLANPVVMSLNNQQALIEIISLIPYESAQQGGDSSVVTIEEKETGIRVTLTPRITNNGYVSMDIKPEQKIFRRSVQTGAGSYPLIDQRNIITSVIVKDEETVALGGLRQFQNLMAERGTPFMMRIPVLSWLFKNNLTTQDRTELVLFVTPRILKETKLTPYENALYDKIDYNWDLPDYYFDQVKTRKAPGEVDPRVKAPVGE